MALLFIGEAEIGEVIVFADKIGCDAGILYEIGVPAVATVAAAARTPVVTLGEAFPFRI